MDDPRTMNQNDPLRDLFLDAGPTQAAAGLEAAVLAQLAKEQVAAPEKALIPRWAWIIAGAFGLALLFLPQAGAIPWEMPTLPHVSMTNGMLWTLGALACGVLLFAVDSVLQMRATRVRTY